MRGDEFGVRHGFRDNAGGLSVGLFDQLLKLARREPIGERVITARAADLVPT